MRQGLVSVLPETVHHSQTRTIFGLNTWLCASSHCLPQEVGNGGLRQLSGQVWTVA